MIERLENPTAEELDALTALWEASVRATHDFLAPEDVGVYRRIVREEALASADLRVIRRPEGGWAAFMGLAGDKIELLFVAPDLLGDGLGAALVRHAVDRCGARRVDVNEQNRRAAGFYARMGFRVAARDKTDPSGRPYPILHMER